MKQILSLLVIILLHVKLSAQAPQKISYQSVIRNTNNMPVANTLVGIKISILQGSASGTVVYSETHNPSTNVNGLASMEIGGGTVLSGTFSSINWAAGPYFVKTETDPLGGTAYTLSGTSQFLSVPYALYAETANVPGVPGPMGPQGPAGLNGVDGAVGPMGPQGPAGLNGVDGAVGPMGPQGVSGPMGPQGPAGLNGVDGAVGPMGPQGVSGPIGPQGPAGLNGVDGAVGPMGLMGPQGVPGPMGQQGATGPMGATGATGPAGPTGATGATGATGPMGPQGPAGTGLTPGLNNGNVKMWDASGNNWVNKNLSTGNTGNGQSFSTLQPYLALNYCIAYQGIFPSQSGVDPFLAEIMLFAGNFSPNGYFFCNGQLIAISQYTALFALLGTNYGGNGMTTFGLPDLRGRVAIHHGNSTGPGLSSYYLGQSGGTENTTLSTLNLPSHNHSVLFVAP
jgi:microcystin-dependent protein